MTLTILKDLDSNLLKIGKKSYENIDIDYIGCIIIKTISNYNSINSVNSYHKGSRWIHGRKKFK